MRFVEIDENGNITAVYDSRFGNVPSGAVPISEQDDAAMRAHPVGFGAFQMLKNGSVSPRQSGAQWHKSEIEELRDLVEILAEAMPNKTPQVTEALARISARKSAIER